MCADDSEYMVEGGVKALKSSSAVKLDGSSMDKCIYTAKPL